MSLLISVIYTLTWIFLCSQKATFVLVNQWKLTWTTSNENDLKRILYAHWTELLMIFRNQNTPFFCFRLYKILRLSLNICTKQFFDKVYIHTIVLIQYHHSRLQTFIKILHLISLEVISQILCRVPL